MRVVNPETGREIIGPETGHTVELFTRPEYVTVKITPSARPGQAYDLATYPPDWIVAS